MMPTTINIDDGLLREAKHRAVDLGLSLSELINRVLRGAVQEQRPSDRRPYRTLVYGARGATTHHAPADSHAATEADDRSGLGGG